MAYIINNWSSAVTPLFYPTQIGVPPTLIWSITDFDMEHHRLWYGGRLEDYWSSGNGDTMQKLY